MPGILTVPKSDNQFPVVIFVHGSGPADKDESIGPNKTFRDLAFGLAKRGIASIRYDKRTLVYRENSTDNNQPIDLNAEVLEDVSSAIRLADSLEEHSSIFVLGHSLGGMLAPEIANRNKQLDGIIMMAANARPLDELMAYQVKYLMSEPGISDNDKARLEALLKQIENLQALKLGEHVSEASLPFNAPKAYWQDVFRYDQVAVAQSLKLPMLILQGGRDYQVTTKDFEIWEKALKNHENVQFELFKKLNHLFLEGEGVSYPKEYQIPGQVPDYVMDAIAAWIMEN